MTEKVNSNPQEQETKMKKTPRKPKKIQEVYIEYMDRQINQQDLINKAESLWIAEGNLKKDITSLKLYVQPETEITYYVINESFYGSFEF